MRVLGDLEAESGNRAGIDGFIGKQNAHNERLHRRRRDQFMALRLRRLFMMMAGRLRGAGHRRASDRTLDAADD